ncbi:unnamed protein product [Sphagnum compactum]
MSISKVVPFFNWLLAVLFALAVILAVSLGFAHQVKVRASRRGELLKLRHLAVETIAKAEADSMLAGSSLCSICKNPTSRRCSRCKAVRYCSLECQRQHWREGHKKECKAPSTSGLEISENGNGTVHSLCLRSSQSMTNICFVKVCSICFCVQILFPYDYFVKLYNWDMLRLPCGLINCGNSCFANVVLQCLTYTRPLTAYLLEGAHVEECRRNDWCFMCELQGHVWRVRQNQTPFSPIRILSRMQNIGNHLGYGRQEDAHEFMRFAIDSMQSTCLDGFGGENVVDLASQQTTLIHHIFGGHLQSQVKCMQCQHESNRYESMMDLAVEIHGIVESLEDALAQFTAPELLDGENKYKCDRCNAYVKADKRLTLHEAPNVLTIALKRFQSGKFGKLNKQVTFPEVLYMGPYMSRKGDEPPVYKLYAVVVHVDMLNASFFGHYICYVKDSQGAWYKIDDSKVKEVEVDKVMSQRAYMLFYSRCSSILPPMQGAVAVPSSPAKEVSLALGHNDGGTGESSEHGIMQLQRPEFAINGLNFDDFLERKQKLEYTVPLTLGGGESTVEVGSCDQISSSLKVAAGMSDSTNASEDLCVNSSQILESVQVFKGEMEHNEMPLESTSLKMHEHKKRMEHTEPTMSLMRTPGANMNPLATTTSSSNCFTVLLDSPGKVLIEELPGPDVVGRTDCAHVANKGDVENGLELSGLLSGSAVTGEILPTTVLMPTITGSSSNSELFSDSSVENTAFRVNPVDGTLDDGKEICHNSPIGRINDGKQNLKPLLAPGFLNKSHMLKTVKSVSKNAGGCPNSHSNQGNGWATTSAQTEFPPRQTSMVGMNGRSISASVVSGAFGAKHKQGRNESCACGSQQKWKKCCGKSSVIKGALADRQLVV